MNIDDKIKEIVEESKYDDFLKKINNNIYLRDSEIKILEKYNFDPKKYTNLSELIYDLEEYLNSYENDELEWISKELSERNYYQNTNK